jgi:hypothetical protein
MRKKYDYSSGCLKGRFLSTRPNKMVDILMKFLQVIAELWQQSRKWEEMYESTLEESLSRRFIRYG